MNIRRVIVLIAGAGLLGASCSYGPEAWQQTGNAESGYIKTTPSVAPTTGPTETLDQIDEDTTKLEGEIDAEMKKNEGDVQGASKEAGKY